MRRLAMAAAARGFHGHGWRDRRAVRALGAPAKPPASTGGVSDLSFVVPPGLGRADARLDVFLMARVAAHRVSRARVQASIRAGLVKVNAAEVLKPGHPLRPDDVVHVLKIKSPPAYNTAAEDIALDVVFEDADVIVVNKPANMVTHPAPGAYSGTLVNALLHHCGASNLSPSPARDDGDGDGDGDGDDSDACFRPGIVHRLDKGTSGLLVCAKTAEAHAHLAAQFAAHTTAREYWSVLCGSLPSEAPGRPRRVETDLTRDPRDRQRIAAVTPATPPDARPPRGHRRAVSRCLLLDELGNGAASLVAWRLETGRTHQIRAHARHLNHPLWGDETYGGTERRMLGELRGATQRATNGRRTHSGGEGALVGFGRPALHARTLGFEHPRTGEALSFEAPLPEDFAALVRRLREYCV